MWPGEGPFKREKQAAKEVHAVRIGVGKLNVVLVIIA